MATTTTTLTVGPDDRITVRGDDFPGARIEVQSGDYRATLTLYLVGFGEGGREAEIAALEDLGQQALAVAQAMREPAPVAEVTE